MIIIYSIHCGAPDEYNNGADGAYEAWEYLDDEWLGKDTCYLAHKVCSVYPSECVFMVPGTVECI